MAFKDRLREEIEYQGLLVKEISAKTGISNSTFLSYIDARGVLPNVETGVKIAKALGVSVEYLVPANGFRKIRNIRLLTMLSATCISSLLLRWKPLNV